MIDFPSRWPAKNPDILQLYTLPTPNGQKASIMLEEIGLPYEAHQINIMQGDQHDPEYLLINPNNKIPSIIDPNGPNGERIGFMEAGAILLYLAEKTGKLMPSDDVLRWQTMQWLFFQTGSVGPMFGQFGHFFKFAADNTSDDYAKQRYIDEAKRIFAVLETRLKDGRQWLVGDEFTVADVATGPWINAIDFYEGHEVLQTSQFANVMAYRDRFYDRPAVKRGAIVGG